METKNSFFSNSLITLTRQLASIVIGITLISVLGRTLGKDGYGEYTLITYVPLMIMTFLNLGLNSSTIYFVSRRKYSLKEIFNTNVLMALLLSLIGIIIGTVVLYLFKESKFDELDLSLLFASFFALPFMLGMIFLQTIFQGQQKFKTFNTALLIQQLGTVISVLIFVLLLDLGLQAAVFSFGIGYFCSVTYCLIILFTVEKLQLNFRSFSKTYLKESVTYGIKAHISNVMTFLNYRLDIFFLGFFLGKGSVGIYSAAVNIGERLSIFSQSISSVLLPRISSSEETVDRNRITALVTRIMTLFMILLGLVVFILSDFIFDVILNSEYESSSLMLQLLIPGIVVLAVEKLLSNDLAGRGKPELNMYVSIFNVVLNVILNLILIPSIGIKGAAIASSITYILSFMIKVIIYSRETKVKPFELLILRKSDVLLLSNTAKKLAKSFM
ncbi:oligosaccharide flippase family protein [Rossellomorea vietnamensis]|uniref:Oligosaccharide flippase family protein n=1 Tax=Rossellomorea vietnamensis TaxID=218284 RepID=A0A6I6UVZ8_9BACI|nr:flippase [Rossellomorea vietnamensis]QHE63372.1 oligosaccharide flippase family protein [Rossellomorea vietnamensis]